jgi:hypothetical protein
MLFEIDQQVRVKGTDEIGTIDAYKIEGYKLNGKKVEIIKYCLKQSGASYIKNWYKEDDLQHLYEFNNTFEKGLVTLLIDVYLKHNKFDLVKKLNIEKNLY